MSELTLISDYSLDTTALSNIYIDEYMSANNEAQIKIYLFLLRNLSKGAPVSVITIADTFNYTIIDVERALFYMEKQGLMSLRVENDCIVGLKLLPLRKKRTEAYRENLQIEGFKLVEVSEKKSSRKVEASDMDMPKAPIKPEYTKEELASFKADSKIDELLFVIQAYTGKPVVVADIKSIKYMHDELKFSVDLIDYLVESCVERNKKTLAYMEKVAIDWYLNGISTVEEAKEKAFKVPDEVYAVFKAFSIKSGSREPSAKETAFVKKWTGKYAFTMDIIERACQITIDNTHSVSFEYADAILTDWAGKGVKHLSDVEALMNAKNNAKTSQNRTAGTENVRRNGKQGANSFNNFSSREYDFAQLEKELLEN